MLASSSSSFRHLVASFVLAACVVALVAQPAAAAGIRYVTVGSSGNCSSWANACSLQTALGAAASGDQVWVKKGVYKPGSVRTDTFTIHAGVAVYGGFAGTETALAQRAPAGNVTVLSGDIDGNDNTIANGIDANYSAISGANSYHVVTMNGTGGTKILANTVLDGFTITAGDAGGSSFPDDSGGGLYCNGSGAGAACSPTLSNLTFSGNHAASFGGGLFNNGESGGDSSPSLTNVTFHGNGGGLVGGAVFNDGENGGHSSPDLTNVTFGDNSANCGAACPVCGNATVEFGEVCDDGNTANETSCPYGQPNCSACNSTCSATLNLTGHYCGDGNLDIPNEACDDGNTADETNCPYGQANCTACNSTCSATLNLTGPYCGDGNLDFANGEVCDDGNTINETSCPYGLENCSTCNATCSAVLNLSGPTCGDGTVDSSFGEACDDNNTLACGTCSSDCHTYHLAAATGQIEAVAGAILNDGESFTISDGQFGGVIFEFDTNNDGVGAGHFAIPVSPIYTSSTMALKIVNAINSSVLAITASSQAGSSVVSLANNNEGAFGNQPILETVQSPGFIGNGMSGGSGYDCASGIGCKTDADCQIGLACNPGSKICQ